jgi:chromosomal replication initiator protein
MHLVDTILCLTADVFQRTPAELVGRSRKRPIVVARQAAMWVIRQRYPSLSLETIGGAIGGRHYTTVQHALMAVEDRAQQDVEYRAQLHHVIARLAPAAIRPGAGTRRVMRDSIAIHHNY